MNYSSFVRKMDSQGRLILSFMALIFIILNIFNSRETIINETKWILTHQTLTTAEKIKLRTNSQFYDFAAFIKKNTPENSIIMTPPQSNIWIFSGNLSFVQYFLYPRRLATDDRERILKDKSINYIFINWGEAEITDERLQGYPKFYVPIKRIITMSGQKALYPERSPYLERFGIIEIERGTSENESLRGLDPNSVEFHFHRAEFLRANEKYKEAIDELNISLKMRADAWAFYVLGDSWERLQNNDLAEYYYKEAIRHGHDVGWFYFALGRLYEKEKQSEMSITSFQDGLSVAPDSTWSSYALGRLYEGRGEIVDAAIYYEKADFLNVKYNSFDSNNGSIALERLKESNPGLMYLLNKIKKNNQLSVYYDSDHIISEDIINELLPDVRDYRVHTLREFPNREGRIEFYWQPPVNIGKLKLDEAVDLVHQLYLWQPHDGALYLWANRDSLNFQVFDLKENKWQSLILDKIKWISNKKYLISIGFGSRGMSASVDNLHVARNDFRHTMASLPVFLGKGRAVMISRFPKPAQIGYGDFNNFRFITDSNN